MKKIYYTLVAFSLLTPLNISLAASGGGGVGGSASSPSKLTNPLGGIDSLESLVVAILKALVAVGTPIAVLFLVYAGFKFVMAKGNPSEIQKAQETLMWTIVGIVILLGATLLSEIVKGTIEELGQGIL